MDKSDIEKSHSRKSPILKYMWWYLSFLIFVLLFLLLYLIMTHPLLFNSSAVLEPELFQAQRKETQLRNEIIELRRALHSELTRCEHFPCMPEPAGGGGGGALPGGEGATSPGGGGGVPPGGGGGTIPGGGGGALPGGEGAGGGGGVPPGGGGGTSPGGGGALPGGVNPGGGMDEFQLPCPETPIKSNIVFILDSSGSMAIPFSMPANETRKLVAGLDRSDFHALAILKELQENPRPDSRLNLAKRLLIKLIGRVAPEFAAGVVRFSGRCSDITEEWSQGKHDRGKIMSVISNSVPKGYTPFAESINQAAGLLYNRKGEPGLIVVLSDGRDTCNGMPCKEAKRIHKHQPEITISIINLGIPDEIDNEVFNCIAKITNGKVYRASSYQTLESAVMQATGIVGANEECR